MAQIKQSSLLEDIRSSLPRRGPQCGVSLLLSTLPPIDAADLRTALADETLASSTIKRVLGRRGHALGVDALQRHRRGDCACDAG